MAKTLVQFALGSGPSEVVGPQTMYVRSVVRLISGNRVILEGPGPIPLDDELGTGQALLDGGYVWEFISTAPSFTSEPMYRVVPVSSVPVQFADLVPVAAPPESADDLPDWVQAVYGSVAESEANKTAAAQSAAAAAASALQAAEYASHAGGLGSVSIDTDGVYYYDPAGLSSVARDTDGVPYVITPAD